MPRINNAVASVSRKFLRRRAGGCHRAGRDKIGMAPAFLLVEAKPRLGSVLALVAFRNGLNINIGDYLANAVNHAWCEAVLCQAIGEHGAERRNCGDNDCYPPWRASKIWHNAA